MSAGGWTLTTRRTRTSKLLTTICITLARRLERPWKNFCSIQMRKWPRGALTSAP